MINTAYKIDVGYIWFVDTYVDCTGISAIERDYGLTTRCKFNLVLGSKPSDDFNAICARHDENRFDRKARLYAGGDINEGGKCYYFMLCQQIIRRQRLSLADWNREETCVKKKEREKKKERKNVKKGNFNVEQK